MPALLSLHAEGLLPKGSRIVGVARRALDRNEFLEGIESSCRAMLGDAFAGVDAWNAFASTIEYLRGDFSDPSVYDTIRERHFAAGAPDALFYLASGPDQFMTIARGLAGAGLGTAGRGIRGGAASDAAPYRRLLVEKPFGEDRASARVLNRALHECFSEADIFRVDHYLGKEAVQNLIYFRFANSVFEPLWNRKYIEKIEIDALEEEGICGRGGFYDRTGAARDMLQNHLVQLLCLVAMERPANLEPEAIREEKVKVLRAIPDYGVEELARRSVRGQYRGGTLGSGVDISGYAAENRVARGSETETYVSLELNVDNWRFADVPFVLRTGKALEGRRSEITIHFRQPPETAFAKVLDQGFHRDGIPPNTLTVRIQPDEGIWLSFNAKAPGEPQLARSELRFDYGDRFGTPPGPEAYQRLLRDALAGDSTLFIRFDETEEAWRIVDAMRDSWKACGTPLVSYRAGSHHSSIDGEAAEAWIASDERARRADVIAR